VGNKGKKNAGDKLLGQKLLHADITEFEKEKDRKRFSIKIIRDIRKAAYVVPNEAKAKVYILLESQLMTTEAQNALLKILEEPPSYLCFILECSSKNLLLPTVLSRATCFSLGQLELGDGVRAKKMELAAQTAEEMALAITAPHAYDLLKKTAVFEKNNKLLALCLPELELIVRDALVLQAGSSDTFSASPKAAAVLAGDLSQARLLKLIEEIRLLDEAIQRNANNNLLITRVCSRLRV
jgi:DNA polymerase-3 subunit delta'